MTWNVHEREVTPESVFRDRRRFLGALAAGAAWAALAPARARAEGKPVARNPTFTLDRPLTDEKLAGNHNIFDEMADTKEGVARAAAGFRTEGWKIHVGGHVKKALTLDVAELARRIGVEERLYRHRCVEAWAMAVPWTGFPMARLIELCEPLAKAKFVRFVSAARPDEMPGWYGSRRVFPYYEALSLAEATCEVAFVATGIYGHPLPPQHGAPLRVVVPWKYGFKSAKSIAAIQFCPERPSTFWNDLSPDKYSWSSNVDPRETNPWPQSHETMLGSEERRPTLLYNGYGEWVSKLYA